MKQVEHVIAAGTLNVVYTNVRLVKQFGGFFALCLAQAGKIQCDGHFLLSQNAAKLLECECSGPQEMVAFWSVLEKRLQFVWKSSDQRASMRFVKESISIRF